MRNINFLLTKFCLLSPVCSGVVTKSKNFTECLKRQLHCLKTPTNPQATVQRCEQSHKFSNLTKLCVSNPSVQWQKHILRSEVSIGGRGDNCTNWFTASRHLAPLDTKCSPKNVSVCLNPQPQSRGTYKVIGTQSLTLLGFLDPLC